MEGKYSYREQQIIDCVAQGLCNKDIASLLRITEGTVKTHIQRIRGKDPQHTSRYALIRMKLREDLTAWQNKWSLFLPQKTGLDQLCVEELLRLLAPVMDD